MRACKGVWGADSLVLVPLCEAASLTLGSKLAKHQHWRCSRAVFVPLLFQVWGGNKRSLKVLSGRLLILST